MKRNHSARLSLVLAAAMALSLTACGPKEPASGSASQSGASSGGASASQSQAVDPAPGGEDVSAPDQTPDVPDIPDVPDTPEVPDTPDPAEQSLADLRLEMEPSAAIAGVFFLGVHDGTPLDDVFYSDADRQVYWERRPFMKFIPMGRYARTDGSEVYCIVPADPQATVKVTEWDESGNGAPVEGKVLYESSSGEPFYIQGNASDIMPNMAVTITDRYGNVLDKYHPAISLKDGTVSSSRDDQPLVLDMTVYYGE